MRTSTACAAPAWQKDTRLAIATLSLALLSGCASIGAELRYDDASHEILTDSRPIPMKIYGTHPLGFGEAVIPVFFNGHSENCLLDTGSQRSVVFSNEFFDALPSAGKVSMLGMSGKNVASPLVLVHILNIGGVALQEHKFVYNTENRARSRPYTCALGLDVLSHGAMTFDFTHATFQLKRRIPEEYRRRALAIFSTGHFAVPFGIDGQGLPAIWDTGAQRTVVDTDYIDAHAGTFEKIGGGGPGKDLLSRSKFDFTAYYAKNLRIAELERVQSVVAAGPIKIARNLKIDAIVGFDLIRTFNWVFDLRRGEWATF